MAQILVLFHSVTGHVYRLAQAIAAGVESVRDCQAILRQVPDLPGSEAIFGPSFAEAKKALAVVPVATVADLTRYDGIAFGSPVHFGNMSSALRFFLDQTVDLWLKQTLVGKPATVFVGSGSGGGREAAVLSIWYTLGIHGMTIVPAGMRGTEQVSRETPFGASPFGSGTIAAAPSPRPSADELTVAKAQGRALAEIAEAWRRAQ